MRLTLVKRLNDHSLAFSNINGAEAMFTIGDGKVFGTFESEMGESFVIEPCSNKMDSCYLMMKRNNAVLNNIFEKGDVWKQRHGESFQDEITKLSRDKQGEDDSKTIATYSLKVYYTYEFRDSTPNVNNFINQVSCFSYGG